MKKICKQCGKEIKGKPKIYDEYFFCKDGTKYSNCLKDYLETPKYVTPQDHFSEEVIMEFKDIEKWMGSKGNV